MVQELRHISFGHREKEAVALLRKLQGLNWDDDAVLPRREEPTGSDN